eukprot:s462_g84.t1
MDGLWPLIDPSLLVPFTRLFASPLSLQAAFDNHDECCGLVREIFPDMVEENVRDLVAELLQWQLESARAFKLLRLSTVTDGLCRLTASGKGDIHSSFLAITQSSAFTVLELATKKRQRKYKDEAPDARSKKFEAERRKRSNTLKNRYKSCRPFEVWLELHRGRKYPLSCKDVIDYMQFRVDDNCGKSVPESFSTALHLIETLGRVPVDEQISKDPLWLGHIKSWTAEISADSEPRKPAEMYTIAMILSLELTVEDESQPIFCRALSRVVLVMVWASLRCDDVQVILPHRSILTNFGLKVVMGKTKTSGPDKPQKEVSAFVYRTVSLSGVDWLGIGYKIWESDLFSYRRDYLVMEPKRHWSGVRRKFAPPSELSSLIRKLLASLRVPQRRSMYWVLMDSCLLLPDGLEMHFTGHSPRNFLTSVAALLGFHRDMRAYLGRWAMGMTSSEEYVRTARQVVNRSIAEGFEEEYFEDDAMSSLCKAAEANGANPNRIKKRHTVMGNMTGRHCLGMPYPTLEVREGDWDVIADDSIDGTQPLLEEQARVDEAQAAKAAQVAESHKYFITVSRRAAHRRLHLAGCFVKPANCCEVHLCSVVTAEDFDSICRACKKRMLQETGKETQEESSSTASSSSTDAQESQRDDSDD